LLLVVFTARICARGAAFGVRDVLKKAARQISEFLQRISHLTLSDKNLERLEQRLAQSTRRESLRETRRVRFFRRLDKPRRGTIPAGFMAERLQISVNQRQLADLLRVLPERISQATNRGVIHRVNGSTDYDLDSAVGEWLEYERAQHAKGKRRSLLERERAALTRIKRELGELRLAAMRQKLVDLDESAGALRAVCLRIRSKFQAALPRVARGCYYAASLQESVDKVRAEFDVVLSELSALSEDDLMLERSFQVVQDGDPGTQTEA
jgi:phage terminase Nu1 subunit (DNA packaging protein)